MESLPVPIVQSLASGAAGVPVRYVRTDADAVPVVLDPDLEIPTIDFGRLLDPGSSRQESLKLHSACQDWGFFQLMNHNIPHELIERVKVDITEFFKLPLETKKEFSQLPGKLEGYGQLFVFSKDQKLDWGDMMYFRTQPLLQRSKDLWPTHPHTFRDTLDNYSSELYLLGKILLNVMAMNLGINPEVMANMLEDGAQSVRFNYYPPCPQADKVVGLSPHSDGSLITWVLQVNEVQGLQIKKNDRWVPVKPLPGAFVVNIGDSFEILSNGKYRSIEHRVVVNPEKERLSVAAFHSPNLDTVIGPLPEIVGGGKANYKTLNNEHFVKLFMSSKLEGKSTLDRMKLNK